MTTINQRLAVILSTIPLLLLIPLLAMQFTDEVNWNIGDFLVMGSLLLITGLLIELLLRKVRKPQRRVLTIAVVLLIFLLIWAELAVGVFGTAFAGS